MALGAIAALNEAGYNKEGGKTIPVFGVDATDAARAKINAGFMTGTIRQDAKGMAEAIIEIANNFITDEDIFDGIEEENVIGKWRVNIPYSAYTGEDAEQK
jgi:methyl-galactoside transport system substrate-binding protein